MAQRSCARGNIQEVAKIEDVFGPQHVDHLLREWRIGVVRPRWRGNVSGRGIIHERVWVILCSRVDKGVSDCGRECM